MGLAGTRVWVFSGWGHPGNHCKVEGYERVVARVLGTLRTPTTWYPTLDPNKEGIWPK